jgi:alkylation response protein AidB-like acyl-CoA dehydrogenase
MACSGQALMARSAATASSPAVFPSPITWPYPFSSSVNSAGLSEKQRRPKMERAGGEHDLWFRAFGDRVVGDQPVAAQTATGGERWLDSTTMSEVLDMPDDETLVDALVDELLAAHPPRQTDPTTFLGQQFDAGLAWVHFDEGCGGLGLNPRLQRRVNDRVAAAGGPFCAVRNPIGYGMCGPTVHAWGTTDQRRRHLRPLFTCEDIWCQLFSEPGAGSDFAGLSSRAARDGDEWIVNGQKVWTTLAHTASYGLLVVRTDPKAVKHAGLTAFVADMRAPGVDVRPLRQMTGEAEFNEVYFNDVRIAHDQMLGSVGDGWRVSLTTLMNERTAIGGSIPRRGAGTIGTLIDTWQALPPERRSRVARDRVARLWVRAEVHRLTNVRANENRRSGDPGPEGSIGKLESANLNKAIYEEVMDLLGADAMSYGSYEMVRPDVAGDSPTLQAAFLRSRANTIEGGTTEVMLNIIGERVLGLPGDVRVDRDIPWAEVARS